MAASALSLIFSYMYWISVDIRLSVFPHPLCRPRRQEPVIHLHEFVCMIPFLAWKVPVKMKKNAWEIEKKMRDEYHPLHHIKGPKRPPKLTENLRWHTFHAIITAFHDIPEHLHAHEQGKEALNLIWSFWASYLHKSRWISSRKTLKKFSKVTERQKKRHTSTKRQDNRERDGRDHYHDLSNKRGRKKRRKNEKREQKSGPKNEAEVDFSLAWKFLFMRAISVNLDRSFSWNTH